MNLKTGGKHAFKISILQKIRITNNFKMIRKKFEIVAKAEVKLVVPWDGPGRRHRGPAWRYSKSTTLKSTKNSKWCSVIFVQDLEDFVALDDQ